MPSARLELRLASVHVDDEIAAGADRLLDPEREQLPDRMQTIRSPKLLVSVTLPELGCSSKNNHYECFPFTMKIQGLS
jgi:hypothetical protein